LQGLWDFSQDRFTYTYWNNGGQNNQIPVILNQAFWRLRFYEMLLTA